MNPILKHLCLVLSGLAFALSAGVPIAGQSFGNAIAVNEGTVFVGEPSYELRSGVVYVFESDGVGGWAQTDRLEPSGATMGNRFGIRLASQDDVLLVSATRTDTGTGSVYVYRKEGDRWAESGLIETTDRSPADSLGSGLAIDGDWVMVSTLAQNGARGATYAFRRQGDGWVQHSKLTPADLLPEDRFGSSIALAGDQMLISSAAAGEGQGKVYHFAYDAATDAWTEQAQLQAPLVGPQSAFGADLAIVGETALVGVPGFVAAIGSVYVYQMNDGTWEFDHLLTPFETSGGSGFGGSISFDGELLWIGAPGDALGGGRSYAYQRDPVTREWTQATKYASDEGGQAFFGSTVGFAGDVFVGSALNADGGAGAAYVYSRGAAGWGTGTRIAGDVLGIDAITGDEVRCSDEGEAALFECESVDLLAFLPLGDMGADRGVITNDVWGWTDPESGREIALVGMSNQTAFVDVSNPTGPVYLGRLPLTEGASANVWRDMKVYADHMFVVADNAGDHGMQIFDLTRLRDLDGSNPETFESDAVYTQIASAHNIVINEETGFAYSVGGSAGGTTCGGGLHMINIQDPKNPEFAGCFQDMTTGRQRTGYSHDAQCVIYRGPDEDYQGREICLGSNETALSIADVTDKSNPVAISMATYPNVAYSHQGWLSEDHTYFFMGDELDEGGGNVETTRTLIWDLADLDDPILATEYFADTQTTDHNLYVLGTTMYQSNYLSGLRVLDISDPLNPVPVGSFDTAPYGNNDAEMNGSWSNYPYFESGIVVVTSQQEGLFLVRYRPRTISE